jgi:endonuclease VIII
MIAPHIPLWATPVPRFTRPHVPEGHTIHRAARTHAALLGGRAVRATSPQGRFTDGAALVDGRVLDRVDAHGKHLLYRFAGGVTVHVHLGLFGRFRVHRGEAPDPRPTVRLRMSAGDATVDLTGPTACEVMEPPAEERLLARLGPDPLRPDADPERFVRRVLGSRAPVGTLLMDQSVVAGVGNVFRAEALLVRGIHPLREGRSLSREEALGLWDTVRGMLEDGVRRGRIVTVDPAEAGRPWSRIPRASRTYVYRRDLCLRCGGDVARWTAGGRNVFACPACQPPP